MHIVIENPDAKPTPGIDEKSFVILIKIYQPRIFFEGFQVFLFAVICGWDTLQGNLCLRCDLEKMYKFFRETT